MSKRVKNIVAIIVALVAVAAITTVIVLASITIKPVAYADGWLNNYEAVDIYYSGTRLSGADENGKLVGDGTDSGKYTYDDVLSQMNFSLFSAAMQFNYGFGLELFDVDNIENNELTNTEVKDVISKIESGDTEGYSFIVRLPEIKSLNLSTYWGNQKRVQNFDTVVFTVTEDSEWARSLTAYAFTHNELYLSSDDPADDINKQTYYKLKFGAKTSSLIDMLDDIYDPVATTTAEED